MAMGDLPQFVDSGHSHTIYGLNNLAQGQTVTGTTSGGYAAWDTAVAAAAVPNTDLYWGLKRQARTFPVYPVDQEKPNQEENEVTRRLVQVFIADPNENVPLEHSMLYMGEQKLTDATDQELFYEIEIKSILDEHNKKRVKWTDRKVKERVEHLEPARVRDLKMIVVTVASF